MNAREDSQFPLPLKAPGGLAIPAEFAEIAAICTATEIEIGGRTMFGIADARDLYAGLKVGRDYTTWIKGRIDQYGFQEGVDYEILDPPDRGNQSGRGGDRRSQVYRLTLAMGKELSMVENNDQGRLVRRYFLWLETQVSRPVDPIEALRDPVTLRALLLQHTEERIKLEAENKVLGAKAETLAVLEGADGSMCISDAAKTLGVGRNELIAFLHRIRWIFKRPGNKNWLAYDAVRPRYMEHEDHPYQDSEGRDRVSTRALVTAAGLVKLADLLVKHGVKKPEGGDA